MIAKKSINKLFLSEDLFFHTFLSPQSCPILAYSATFVQFILVVY